MSIENANRFMAAEKTAVRKILLSLAPVPAEMLKQLIQRSSEVPDFDVTDGHEIREEELAKAFAKAEVVLGTRIEEGFAPTRPR